MRLLLSLLFLFTLTTNALAADEDLSTPELTEVVFFGSEYNKDDTVSLKGKYFGTEEGDLRLIINGKNYSVKQSYGNMLDFVIRSEMHSGQIYIEKYVTTDGKQVKLESNRIDIDFGEPQVEKIEAPKGLLPDKDLIIYGNNLKDARVWCGDTAFDTYEQEKEIIKIRVPNTYLKCLIEVTNNGFLSRTHETVEILPIPKADKIKLQNNEIIVSGEGFSPFKDTLNKVGLKFGRKSLGASDYLSDSEIRFTKGQAIPAKGNAILTLNTTSLPPVAYDFQKDIPNIEEISTVTLSSDGKTYEFAIETDSNLQQLDATPVLYMNNRKMTTSIDGTFLRVSSNSEPTKSASAWIELDGFQGETFLYNLNFDFTPKVSKLYTLSNLRTSSGKIRIEGFNFFNKDRSKVKSSMGDLEINRFGSNAIEVTLPLDGTEDKHHLSVSTPFGLSDNVFFTIPYDKNKVIYATPFIEEIVYPKGPYKGEDIIITGTALENILALEIEGVQVKPKRTSFDEIEFTLPQSIPLSGSLILINQDRVESNTLEYTLTQKPENTTTEVSLDTETLELSTDPTNWQTIQTLTIDKLFNNQTLSFEIQFECQKDCSSTLPFSDFQIINSDRKTQLAKFSPDQQKLSLRISQFHIPASSSKQTFSIQVKAFEKYQHDSVFTTKLGLTQLRDELNEVQDIQKSKNEGEIQITSGTLQGFCFEQLEVSQWEDCPEEETEIETVEETIEPQSENEVEKQEEKKVDLKKTKTPQRDTKKNPKFSDLDTAQWYMPFVENLYQRGIINGFADGNFKPAGNLNRAELLKMILVARGESWNSYATVHFEDTANHWAKDMLEYALEMEYINPSKKFQPLKSVSRAETTKMLCKMFPVLEERTSSKTHFTDLQNHWSKDCVMAAFNANVIKGTSSNQFSPNDLITRAEFSKILANFLELLE